MDQREQIDSRTTRLRWRHIVAFAGLLLAVGCSSSGDVELLEAQLRRQEDAMRGCRGQLTRTQQELQRAQREIDQLQRQLSDVETASATLLPEQVSALAQAEAIAVDTWRTGFVDQDNRAGVDHLLLVLYPHDADGDVVKVFGELEIEALDLSRPAAEQLLGHWTFSTEQARDLWHVGFVSTGFHINVPLPQQPHGAELLLHASLSTIDGREFTVTHALPVRRRLDPVTPTPESTEQLPPDGLHFEPSAAAPLPATGRSVLVPEPPADQVFDVDREDATESEPAWGGGPAATDDATFPETGRPLPTTTSDNWTIDEIPAWR